ncbi:hypothetical protein [Gloeothece verrucosa]|uniref:Peptidase C39-like domain-containing protein n=1 Tax=Gloeothece verrucosa (strain PCC 7822) TaxID=497965 RepID=E0UFT2_GLOV7|nr:hypothetical protein [Gloeothece verrucosa]ADN13193.1 hypothetical protein Cyan7822_1187 [Gloeothece verrucosa PCC 7822]
MNTKIKAIVNTVIKQSTFDSTQIADPLQKFSLAKGDELEIKSYELATNNHWKLQLISPVQNVTQWFAFIPDVTISDFNEYTKALYPGLVLDAYKNIIHALIKPDLPLLEHDGRKLFEQGILPILQSSNTFKQATDEGEQKLAKLVAHNQDQYGIHKAPCAYSVSCVMKYIAQKLGFTQIMNLFENPSNLNCVQVTGVEIMLRRLGFNYFLKKDYLAPRGAIGARAPRNSNDESGHIYFITKDGAKRTQFPNPGQGNDPPETGTNGPDWMIKDLHAENLHFFDHVYIQWQNGYTDGFWLPTGIYPLQR